SGCRSESSACAWNSGNSSRNSTPWWASEISPGRACKPPPTSAGMLAEWCGARNGRRLVSAPPSISPAIEATIETSSSLAGASGGRIDGRRGRQHRLAGAGRADHEKVVPAGRSDFEGALGAFLALDVGEIEQGSCRFQDFRLRPRQHLRALEMIGELNERGRGNDLDFRARPRRFRPAD